MAIEAIKSAGEHLDVPILTETSQGSHENLQVLYSALKRTTFSGVIGVAYLDHKNL